MDLLSCTESSGPYLTSTSPLTSTWSSCRRKQQEAWENGEFGPGYDENESEDDDDEEPGENEYDLMFRLRKGNAGLFDAPWPQGSP